MYVYDTQLANWTVLYEYSYIVCDSVVAVTVNWNIVYRMILLKYIEF